MPLSTDLTIAQILKQSNPSFFNKNLDIPIIENNLSDINFLPINSQKPIINDFYDSLTYSNKKIIDFDKKILNEFAILRFLLSKRDNNNHLPSYNDLEILLNEKDKSNKNKNKNDSILLSIIGNSYLNLLVSLLNCDNENKNNFKFSNDSNTLNNSINSNNDNLKIENDIEQLIKYLLPYLIKNNIKIDLNFQNDKKNSKEFLKHCIDSLINSKSLKLPHNDTNISNNSKLNSDNNEFLEIKTAFNDLKLAHKFLTEQFKNERFLHNNDIERLQMTNKELQEKLLIYHSDLTLATENLKTEIHKRQSLIDSNNNNTTTNDILNTTDTTNVNQYSLNIVRNEFKKILIEKQKNYDDELKKERDLRLQLEKEVFSLRNNGYKLSKDEDEILN